MHHQPGANGGGPGGVAVQVRFGGLLGRGLNLAPGEAVPMVLVPKATMTDLCLALGERFGARMPQHSWDAAAARFHDHVRIRVDGEALKPDEAVPGGAHVLVAVPIYAERGRRGGASRGQ